MEEWFEPLSGGQMILAVLAGCFFWAMFFVLNFWH
jgi:hypothetical protein